MDNYTNNQHFTLFTIGHGTRSFDCFLLLLKKYDIKVVIDVRTFPYSRFQPQYRRTQLTSSLKLAGIDYLFLGEELGGRPKAPDLYIEGKLDLNAVKQTPLFRSGMVKVIPLATKVKVTLMCSESNPDDCHRKHLIANELVKKGFFVWHINKGGELEQHTNGKPSLFD